MLSFLNIAKVTFSTELITTADPVVILLLKKNQRYRSKTVLCLQKINSAVAISEDRNYRMARVGAPSVEPKHK